MGFGRIEKAGKRGGESGKNSGASMEAKFDAFAQQLDADLVEKLMQEEGKAPKKEIRYLNRMRKQLNKSIDALINDMIEFSLKYLERTGDTIPKRESYSEEKDAFGEMDKAFFFVAFKKYIINDTYEYVEKSREQGMASVLGLLYAKLSGLLSDMDEIRNMHPQEMLAMIMSNIGPEFDEICKLLGLADGPDMMEKFCSTKESREYMKLFWKMAEKYRKRHGKELELFDVLLWGMACCRSKENLKEEGLL